MDNIGFSETLLKGKIAEIVFEQMFRKADKFTILHGGYEYVFPELAQYQHLPEVQTYIENIRHLPDFVLISNDKKKAFLVEVKYRSQATAYDLKRIAQNTLKTWNPSWLFVASPEGFFFAPTSSVVKNDGEINRLSSNWVDKKTQEQYLQVLRKFEIVSK